MDYQISRLIGRRCRKWSNSKHDVCGLDYDSRKEIFSFRPSFSGETERGDMEILLPLNVSLLNNKTYLDLK